MRKVDVLARACLGDGDAQAQVDAQVDAQGDREWRDKVESVSGCFGGGAATATATAATAARR